MSRTWTRAALDTDCGVCWRTVGKDQPLFVVAVPGVERPFARCPACAGEPVPAEIPARLEPAPRILEPLAMTSVRTLAAPLAHDFKQAQGADREPGDEDDADL